MRALIAAVVSVAGLAGCGSDDTGPDKAAQPEPTGPVHVHGLGVNPADRALFVATHSGLFRSPPSADTSERVGDGYQDTMGFTVVGEDHFLGSGHPGPGEQQPPLLGLIESRDAGKSWRSVSMLGEADFHVLEAQGRTVYGYDASGGRFMASDDGGRAWSERTVPEALLAVAVDPRDDQRLVASGEAAVYSSGTGGRRWTRLGREPGYLSWPSRRALYSVAPEGTVRKSDDAGRTWRKTGAIEGQIAAFEAARPRELYVALHDGTIQASLDGGRSWSVRSTP